MIARLRAEHGLTLIEVMVAIMVLTVGMLAVLTTLDAARQLTLLSERRESMTHVAQRELERLQALSWNELALSSAPTHSIEEANPDYYVDRSPAKCTEVEKGGCFAYGKSSEEEPLVVASGGKLSPTPSGRSCSESSTSGVISVGACEWSSGTSGHARLSGDIYDFVTWHEESICTTGKCTIDSEKRLTVVVTATTPSSGHATRAVTASVLIPEPSATSGNPAANPEITCGASKEACIQGIAKGKATIYTLHDTPVEGVEQTAENHAVHDTVAPSSSECTATKTTSTCPKPDLMSSTGPRYERLYNFSSPLDPAGYAGGRLLQPSAECSAEPSGGNAAEELWVTEPQSSAVTLLGAGGIDVYTESVNNAIVTAKLCIGIYEVAGSKAKFENLVEYPPKKLAYAEVAPTGAWPTTMEPLSLPFSFTEETIKSGERIGIRLWESQSSTGAIAIAYDVAQRTETIGEEEVTNSGDDSIVQLNTK